MVEHMLNLSIIVVEQSIFVLAAAVHEVEDVVLLALVIAVWEVNIKVVHAVYAVVGFLDYLAFLLTASEIAAWSFFELSICVVVEVRCRYGKLCNCAAACYNR